jgi:ankyrin repeat protein
VSHPFIALVRRGATTEIAEQVEHDPSIAQSRDAQGVSALLWAVYSGQTVVRDFLLSGLETLDIHEAAAVGDVPKLKSLLAAEPALARSVSSDGWPPLHLAAAFGTPDAVRVLLDHGADVHQVSPAMRNLAMHAAVTISNHPETIRLLLAHGADVNAVQMGGFTPLHGAASAGKSEIAEVLLAGGADAAMKCDRGKTAADYAEEKGHKHLAERLRFF